MELHCIECVQRRATKYILQDYDSSNVHRPKLHNLRYMSDWHKMGDIISFYKVISGLYDLSPEDYIVHPDKNLTRFCSTNSYRPSLCKST